MASQPSRKRPWGLLAAYLSAHRTMINGRALCTALAVTERDWLGGFGCSQTVQNAESALDNRKMHA